MHSLSLSLSLSLSPSLSLSLPLALSLSPSLDQVALDHGALLEPVRGPLRPPPHGRLLRRARMPGARALTRQSTLERVALADSVRLRTSVGMLCMCDACARASTGKTRKPIGAMPPQQTAAMHAHRHYFHSNLPEWATLNTRKRAQAHTNTKGIAQAAQKSATWRALTRKSGMRLATSPAATRCFVRSRSCAQKALARANRPALSLSLSLSLSPSLPLHPPSLLPALLVGAIAS